MAPSTFNLQEEVLALQDQDTYQIANEHEIEDSDAAEGLLAGASTSPATTRASDAYDASRCR